MQNVIFMILCFCSTYVIAEDRANMLEIKEDIAKYVHSNLEVSDADTLEVEVRFMQNEINLEKCKTPVQLSMPRGIINSRTVMVNAECQDQPGWQLYVPVTVKYFTDIVVAKSDIAAQQLITESMLSYKKIDKYNEGKQGFVNMENLQGMVATSMIPSGSVITSRNIKKIALIKRNQPVNLLFKRGALTVSMLGVAQADGYLHDVIQVLNPSSKKVVDAVVVGSGNVEIYG
jgi:flagellar basal body P-ring formation protein FlgA